MVGLSYPRHPGPPSKEVWLDHTPIKHRSPQEVFAWMSRVIGYFWWKKSCTSLYGTYPTIHKVLYISRWLAGFLNHHQYPMIFLLEKTSKQSNSKGQKSVLLCSKLPDRSGPFEKIFGVAISKSIYGRTCLLHVCCFLPLQMLQKKEGLATKCEWGFQSVCKKRKEGGTSKPFIWVGFTALSPTISVQFYPGSEIVDLPQQCSMRQGLQFLLAWVRFFWQGDSWKFVANGFPQNDGFQALLFWESMLHFRGDI